MKTNDSREDKDSLIVPYDYQNKNMQEKYIFIIEYLIHIQFIITNIGEETFMIIQSIHIKDILINLRHNIENVIESFSKENKIVQYSSFLIVFNSRKCLKALNF